MLRIIGSTKLNSHVSPASQTVRYINTVSRQGKIKLKFFTKPDCMLCYGANVVLENALDEIDNTKPNMRGRIADVEYVNIGAPENKEWFDCYRYDIPVLHVERERCKKVVFMHSFDQEELVEELGQEL